MLIHTPLSEKEKREWTERRVGGMDPVGFPPQLLAGKLFFTAAGHVLTLRRRERETEEQWRDQVSPRK